MSVELIRCRKCGAMITTQDTMVECMMEEVERLNRLAEKDVKYNRGKLKMLYAQQSAQVYKMMKQIIHLTSQMDEHSRILNQEKGVLVHYLLQNGLITEEKLHELEAYARERAAQANARDQKQIELIYGSFQSECTNRSKADPTAQKAVGNKGG